MCYEFQWMILTNEVFHRNPIKSNYVMCFNWIVIELSVHVCASLTFVCAFWCTYNINEMKFSMTSEIALAHVSFYFVYASVYFVLQKCVTVKWFLKLFDDLIATAIKCCKKKCLYALMRIQKETLFKRKIKSICSISKRW